jgi:hypothetical protein
VLVVVLVLDKQSHLVCGVEAEREKTGGRQSRSNEANRPNPVQSIPLRFEDEDEHEPLVADFGVSSVERFAALRAMQVGRVIMRV